MKIRLDGFIRLNRNFYSYLSYFIATIIRFTHTVRFIIIVFLICFICDNVKNFLYFRSAHRTTGIFSILFQILIKTFLAKLMITFSDDIRIYISANWTYVNCINLFLFNLYLSSLEFTFV